MKNQTPTTDKPANKNMACNLVLAEVNFTADEVKSIIQSIYAEFAELDRSRYYPHELRRIIELEVEQGYKPIKIFK